MKTSTFNFIVNWGAGTLTVALIFLAVHIIAISFQYDNDYKLKTLRESQQQQDRIEEKLDYLVLEKYHAL